MGLVRNLLPTIVALVLVSSAALVAGIGTIPSVKATSGPIALDGSASSGCGYTTNCSASLTTSQRQDIVFVGCNCFPYGAAFSVRDTAGLNFLPGGPKLSIGGNQLLQIWYAISASPLTSDTISVVSSVTGETWYGIVVFALSGANTVNPFFIGYPISQANLACGKPCNQGLSAPAGSLLFQVGGDTGNTLQTAGPGMQLIQSHRGDQDVYAQYEVLGSPITAATAAFGTTQGSDFGVIAVAVQPSSGGPSGPTTSTISTTTTSTTTSKPASSTSSTTVSSSTTSSHSSTTILTSTTTSTTVSTATSTTASSTTSSTTTTISSTKTTSSASTITSSTSSAGAGTPGSGVFYLGAQSKDPSALPNTGVRSSIQVNSFNVPVGCVSFWVSEASSSNLWMQVGYYICSGSTPVVFTQVWNLNTNALVYGNTFGTTPTTGTHQFAIQVQSGTTWVATFDGQTVGTCNLGSSTSSSTYPVYAMSEENSLAAAIAIPTTAFPVALQVLRSGAWLNPSTVTVYNFGGTWGIEGPVQDASLAPDSFVVGGPLATLSAGTVL